jgi:uncharacterized protein
MAQYAAESENSSYAAPAIANPGPLGLSAFALTTFVIGTIYAGWFNVGTTSIVVGLALFYGGLSQLLAGMWEFKTGNTFGGTAFTTYGAFWLSYAVISIPGFGIASAFTTTAILHQALGVYLLAWTIITAILLVASLRSNMALIAVFAFLTLTFLSLTIGELATSTAFHTLGGYLGIITAIVAWYTALAGLLSSGRSAFTLPVGPIS